MKKTHGTNRIVDWHKKTGFSKLFVKIKKRCYIDLLHFSTRKHYLVSFRPNRILTVEPSMFLFVPCAFSSTNNFAYAQTLYRMSSLCRSYECMNIARVNIGVINVWIIYTLLFHKYILINQTKKTLHQRFHYTCLQVSITCTFTKIKGIQAVRI
jgi:hypothetical protein